MSARRWSDAFDGPFAASQSPPRADDERTLAANRDPLHFHRLFHRSCIGDRQRERESMRQLPRNGTVTFERQPKLGEKGDGFVQGLYYDANIIHP